MTGDLFGKTFNVVNLEMFNFDVFHDFLKKETYLCEISVSKNKLNNSNNTFQINVRNENNEAVKNL